MINGEFVFDISAEKHMINNRRFLINIIKRVEYPISNITSYYYLIKIKIIKKIFRTCSSKRFEPDLSTTLIPLLIKICHTSLQRTTHSEF